MGSQSELDINGLLQLPTEERLEYAIDRVLDKKEIWGLMGPDGWILLSVDDDTCLPIWHSKGLAIAWAKGESLTVEPECISLQTWRDTWLPGMKTNGTAILLCPLTSENENVILEAEQVLAYITESDE